LVELSPTGTFENASKNGSLGENGRNNKNFVLLRQLPNYQPFDPFGRRCVATNLSSVRVMGAVIILRHS